MHFDILTRVVELMNNIRKEIKGILNKQSNLIYKDTLFLYSKYIFLIILAYKHIK